MKKGRSIKALALAAMVAALYIAATGLFAPISFGGIQVRVSEALCALALFSPWIRADGDSEVRGRGGATSVSDGRDRRLECLHDLDVDYYPGILSVGK